MKTKIISTSIIILLVLCNALVLFGIISNAQTAVWPSESEWILTENDSNEKGCEDYKDVQAFYYHLNDYYLYLRLQFYGFPNITENDMRLKWFIDTDDPHNMGWTGNKIHDAEFLLFIEDSPKPHGDGSEDIYLISDSDNDGFMNDETKNGNGTGYGDFKISNPEIAGFRIEGHYLDMYISQAYIGNPVYPFITWTSDQGDPNLDSSSANDQSDAYWNPDLAKADISIEKISSKNPVFTNETFTYTLTITNHGPHIAYGYNITDIQPNGINFDETTPVATEINGLEYRWYIPVIDVGDSFDIKINVSINNGFYGIINNTAIAFDTYDPAPQNNIATNKITVLKIVGLSIKKSSEYEAPAHAGSLIVYTINVTNHGPDEATNINVTDTLPDGVSFVGAVPDVSEVNGMDYIWFIPSLTAGESKIIKINVTVNEGVYGTIINTATIEHDSYDPGNESEDNDTIVVVPVADISVNKTSEYEAPAHAGSLIVYTINVTNHGPDNVTDITVIDNLPTGVSFVSAVPDASEVNGSEYRWFISLLNSSESFVIKINVTVNEGVYGTIVNTVEVEGDYYDPNPGGDDDEIEIPENGGGGGSGGNGGGSGGHYTPPTDNDTFIDEKPTAIISGIYTGVPFEEIEFDGTESHDNDEEGQSIIQYDWKFSDELDWQIDLGATPTYIYTLAGVYNVTLKVIDDENNFDTNTTIVTIIKPNSPPATPQIDGPQNGTTNISYNFTVVSTDEDGDKLKYIIDWGDETTSESGLIQAGIVFPISHKWIEPGEYTITVTANDNNTISSDKLTIEIKKPTKERIEFPWWLLFLILFLILLLLVILEKRRRDKKKQENLKTTTKKASTKQ